MDGKNVGEDSRYAGRLSDLDKNKDARMNMADKDLQAKLNELAKRADQAIKDGETMVEQGKKRADQEQKSRDDGIERDNQRKLRGIENAKANEIDHATDALREEVQRSYGW
jgi:hypothetical protein